MKKVILILAAVLTLALPCGAYAQKFTVSGVVLDKTNRKPIDMAVVTLPNSELWAVANGKGEFVIKNVPKGATKITASCLGYVTKEFDITVQRDVTDMTFLLDEDNLAIEGVVVTAQENRNSMSTSRTIDRTTMDHMQMVNVSDIAGMLPGGATTNPNLLEATKSKFSVRGYGEDSKEMGFGTAIEVDGVRMSNNADFGSMSGVDTRNIGSANVESIEVITGVPSVEYGDIATGVVKIHTKKGRTPYVISTTINPKTKQFALSKGFDMGDRSGALNFSIERARSVRDLPSPYTAYDRNTATLNYSNTFNQGEDRHPLRLSIGLTGNLGGMDSKADPDAFLDTYDKMRDNNFRGNLTLNWLLNKPWITGLEFNGSVSYTDRLQRVKSNKSSATSIAARHGMEEGYFMSQDFDVAPDAPVTLIPAGYWYEMKYVDSKPVDYSAHLKANWVRRWGEVNSKFKLGLHYTGNGNEGRGIYYGDPKYADPAWRPYEYRDEPYMNNVAVYLEESLTIPIKSTSLDLVAGLRNDNTIISGSAYGTVSSFSPRFNAKYTLFDGRGRNNKALRSFSVRAAWGKMVKLPSFYTLYPTPTYSDVQTFAAPTTEDGTSFVAWYMQPARDKYNPDLKWQYTNQTEVGVDFNLYGVKVSLSGYYNKTVNPYITQKVLEPYSYKLTTIRDLDGCEIPVENRRYSIDRETGIVTVTDKTGGDSYEATFTQKNTFRRNDMTANGSSYKQMGLEWIIDFGQIRAIRTDIRIDGAFTYYKRAEQTMMTAYPNAMGAGGEPYKYLGWYIGGDVSTNGSLKKQVRANLTLTTHIPKIRTIISLRVETSLYRFQQNLSEWYAGGGRQRSYLIEGNDRGSDPLVGQSIYGGGYVVTYPAYYSTFDDPQTKIPFMEKFLDAKQNDPVLYSELINLVNISTSAYSFRPSKISAYCSINLSITKEIGKIASISFYANNCFNNMGRVHNSADGDYLPLYYGNYIPKFYYGASLRLKF